MSPVLLITGASRGIGAATAKLAAARGYDVGVNYKSDAASAAAVVEAVKTHDRKAVAVAADMALESDVERMFKTVDDQLGPLTHFVYNTGVPGLAGRLDTANSAMMRDVIDVNVHRARCGRCSGRSAACRRSTAARAVRSCCSRRSRPTSAAPNEYVWYAARRARSSSMTVGLRKELAGDGIRVNACRPAPATPASTPTRGSREAPNGLPR